MADITKIMTPEQVAAELEDLKNLVIAMRRDFQALLAVYKQILTMMLAANGQNLDFATYDQKHNADERAHPLLHPQVSETMPASNWVAYIQPGKQIKLPLGFVKEPVPEPTVNPDDLD